MNAPEKLFENCDEWQPGAGVLQWSNDETGEHGIGDVWECGVGPFWCQLEEIPGNVRANIFDQASDDFNSREEALAWMRTEFLSLLNDLNKATSSTPIALPPDDLTQAQELLREWREAAGDKTRPEARIEWCAHSGSWTSWVSWADTLHTRTGYPGAGPNPLAAVRAAIGQTPWAHVSKP